MYSNENDELAKCPDQTSVQTVQRGHNMDESTVLVKDGRNNAKYHRVGTDGTPDCSANGCGDAANWEEWDKDTADAWKEPCQYPQCYGDLTVTDAKKGDLETV